MTVAILIPCYNEETTIEKVVLDFRRELPEAKIYVYDNNSTDNTIEKAISAGAIVREEKKQGKSNVVRSMLYDIDADIYVLVDGDDTYPAQSVHKLIEPIKSQGFDLVIGDRHSNGSYKKENSRPLHNFGNNIVKNLINTLYEENLKDIMSGYRVFSKHFAMLYPILSEGFELETEMAIFAVDRKLKIKEIEIDYRDRPENSFSKLSTIRDGGKVLKTILTLFKDYKPLKFFFYLFLSFFAVALAIGFPVIYEFLQTGEIKKIPSAILASGIMVLAFMSIFIGFILDTISRHRREDFELVRKKLNKDFPR